MSWSKKYKKSIDCSHPKGFSQKAHCAGRKARQGGHNTKSKSVNEMKLSQLKEEIRTIIRERGVASIQKEYGKVVSEMEHHLELYKKSKGTPEEKKHISTLKTLTVQKKKLQSELDAKVASLYKDAELKVDENIDEVGIGDWHFKAIEQLYKKAGSFGRKKIAALITKNPNSSWDKIAKELKDSDYSDVSDYTDVLHLESINEISYDSNGNLKIKKQYKTLSDYEKNAKNGDMVWVGKNPNEFKRIGKALLSKVLGKDSDGNVILTPFGKNKKYTIPQKDQAVIVVESVNEGKKAFKVNPGIGSSKYSISSHDGHKKHNDGSDFWDIKIFKNKVDLEKGIKDFKSKGFVEESINESTFQKGKTYGGTKCEGGCFLGKNGLIKIIKISKENPTNTFIFRDDNYSGLQPHFIKNGVIAKANTLGNPSYDLERHKINNLKIGNDVVLSIQLFN